MGGADLPTAMEDEWVETVASAAYYARNNRKSSSACLRLTMSPDWDGIEGIRMDRWQHARVMRKLAQRARRDRSRRSAAGGARYCGHRERRQRLPAVADGRACRDGEAGPLRASTTTPAIRAVPPMRSGTLLIRARISGSRRFPISGTRSRTCRRDPSAILVWDGYDSVYNHAILAGRGSNPPNDVGNGPALLAYSTQHAHSTRRARRSTNSRSSSSSFPPAACGWRRSSRTAT